MGLGDELSFVEASEVKDELSDFGPTGLYRDCITIWTVLIDAIEVVAEDLKYGDLDEAKESISAVLPLLTYKSYLESKFLGYDNASEQVANIMDFTNEEAMQQFDNCVFDFNANYQDYFQAPDVLVLFFNEILELVNGECDRSKSLGSLDEVVKEVSVLFNDVAEENS
jgi:hypothetical protein